MDLASLLMPMLSGGMGAQGSMQGMQPVQPPGTQAQQGSMAPFMNPDQMAQLQTDTLDYQRKNQLANALMSQGYVPNSGKFGMLAGIASMLGGKLAQNSNDAKLSDIIKRQYQADAEAASAARAQQRDDIKFKTDEEIRKEIADKQAGLQYAPMTYAAGLGGFDPRTGQVSIDPNVQQTDIATKTAEAMAAARAAAMYREAPGAGEIAGLNAKLALAQKMGATPDQLRAMITGTAAQNPETQVVGSMLVDKRTGKATPILDPTTGKMIDASADAKSNAVVEKAQGGLAKQVLNYVSTATKTPVETLQKMTPEEVENLYRRKGGRDWGTALASVLPGGTAIAGKFNPNLNSFATGAQAMEARIQHPVGTIPYNAEVLARQSSIGPEKTDEFNARFIRSALEDAAGEGSGAAQPLVASQGSGAQSAIPAPAIARLKANPSEAALFDAQFGQGSAAQVLGGR